MLILFFKYYTCTVFLSGFWGEEKRRHLGGGKYSYSTQNFKTTKLKRGSYQDTTTYLLNLILEGKKWVLISLNGIDNGYTDSVTHH